MGERALPRSGRAVQLHAPRLQVLDHHLVVTHLEEQLAQRDGAVIEQHVGVGGPRRR